MYRVSTESVLVSTSGDGEVGDDTDADEEHDGHKTDHCRLSRRQATEGTPTCNGEHKAPFTQDA